MKCVPDLPVTTTLLLHRLSAQADPDSWQDVDRRYRPVLLGFARALGLSAADAEDAAQWTLAEAARLLGAGDYRRERGRLRSWIFGIARHRVQMLKRAAARRRCELLHDRTPDLPDEATLSSLWTRETQKAALERAWHALRAAPRTSPESLRAFELVVLRRVPAEQAAAECGLSLDALYAAKSRLLKRLRELVAESVGCYNTDE